MIIKKITLIICCVFSIQIAATSCSCFGEPTFCGVLNSEYNDWTLSHVIQAVKLKDTLHGMIVLPERSFINEVPNEPIIVWGDPGFLCRIYTSQLAVGEKFILGIKQMDYPEYDHEKVGDFFLSFCGLHFLNIKDDVVTGAITEEVSSMGLEDFEVYMETEAYKENCSMIYTGTSDPDKIDDAIEIFPNPVQDIVNIRTGNQEEEIQSVNIYDSRGQLMKTQKMDSSTGYATMNLDQLANGIYFMQIRMRDKIVSKKIVVQ